MTLRGFGRTGRPNRGAAENVTVSTTEPTRPGYTFMGWNTEADGSGTSYGGDDTYICLILALTRCMRAVAAEPKQCGVALN